MKKDFSCIIGACLIRRPSNSIAAPTFVTEKKRAARSAFFARCAPICLAFVCTLGASVFADTITVTNGNDSGPGSLRQALADANDGDIINFDPAVSTVILTTAELAINKSITVSSTPFAVTVARSSQNQFRIFHVMPDQAVTIDGLHIVSGGGGSGAGV